MKKEANKEYVKNIINICDKHTYKHSERRMTIKGLDKLCGVS